jgi:transglutaminase-like putative cysteine protease
MKPLLLLTIIAMACVTQAGAQKAQNVDLTIGYQITNSEKTTKVHIVTLVPNDQEFRQKVNSLEFSLQPDTVYCVGSDKYAEFTFEEVIPEEVTIKVNMDIYRSDYTTMSKLKPQEVLGEKERKAFISPSKYIESKKDIITEKAEELKKKKQITTLKSIYYFVNNHIKYIFDDKTWGAFDALKTGFGDCSEYASLMVALCRANGIPAKVVYGITTEHYNTPLHEWAEVYIDGIGWVAFDPTSGNNAQFGVMENKYILISANRDVQHFIEYYYTYRIWGATRIAKINSNYTVKIN